MWAPPTVHYADIEHGPTRCGLPAAREIPTTWEGMATTTWDIDSTPDWRSVTCGQCRQPLWRLNTPEGRAERDARWEESRAAQASERRITLLTHLTMLAIGFALFALPFPYGTICGTGFLLLYLIQLAITGAQKALTEFKEELVEALREELRDARDDKE
jgi:hypothetical protein